MLLTCCRRLTVLWMRSTLHHAEGICTTCSSCSTTWLCVIKRCRCLKSVHNVLSMRSNIYPLAWSISKKKVFHIEWEKCSSSESSSFNIVPFFHRSTDTKMPWIKLERESKCAIKWLTICTSCANFTSKERRLMQNIRIVKTTPLMRLILNRP